MQKLIPVVLIAVSAALGSKLPLVNNVEGFSNLLRLPNDQSWAAGKSSLVAVGEPLTADLCSAVFSCRDCNTARVCRPTADGKLTPVITLTCPTDRPFCDYNTGSCTTSPDASCGKTDDFVCMSDGHFPDVDCKTYHVCEGYQPHLFKCVIPGESYNAATEKCEPSTTCAKFNCDEKGKKVSNDLYPNYYAFCDQVQDKVAPVIVSRCPGINQLNTTSQLCEPNCSEEGVLQDIEDCNKYYKCHYLWINENTKYMVRERLNCPTNTAFHPKDFICVDRAQYPECKASK